MKELIIIASCLFLYQVVMAQTLSEWLRQNSTQLQYLQQQIAALQAYNATQQTGYAVSETGLMVIDTTEEADYDEHAAHFAYQRQPSVPVLFDPRIGEIDTLCERSLLVARAIESLGPAYAGGARDWSTVSQRISRDIEDSIGSLATHLVDVLAADKLIMSDAAREQAIGALRGRAERLYGWAARSFELFTKKTILR